MLAHPHVCSIRDDVRPPCSGTANIDIRYFIKPCSSKLTGATAFYGVNLGLGPCQPLESRGQLSPIEKQTLASFDRAERRSWCTADVAAYDAGVLVCLIEGTMLLRFLAVAGKGLGERVGRGGGVRVGCVVDLCVSLSIWTLGSLGYVTGTY